MTYTVKETINTTLVDDLIAYTQSFNQSAQQTFAEVFAEVRPQLLDELRFEPEPPNYPEGETPWVGGIGGKQHRRVMIKLRQEAIARGDVHQGPRGGLVVNDLRYQRKHGLRDGWQVEPIYEDGKLILVVTNPTPSARFVVGDLNQRSLAEAAKPQQPFHSPRWPLAAATVAFWFGVAHDEVQRRMSEQFGDFIKVTAQRRSRSQ